MEIPQIQAHVETYRKYLDLVSKKKELLAQYKECKDKAKARKLEEVDSQPEKLRQIDRRVGVPQESKRANSAAANADIKADL